MSRSFTSISAQNSGSSAAAAVAYNNDKSCLLFRIDYNDQSVLIAERVFDVVDDAAESPQKRSRPHKVELHDHRLETENRTDDIHLAMFVYMKVIKGFVCTVEVASNVPLGPMAT